MSFRKPIFLFRFLWDVACRCVWDVADWLCCMLCQTSMLYKCHILHSSNHLCFEHQAHFLCWQILTLPPKGHCKSCVSEGHRQQVNLYLDAFLGAPCMGNKLEGHNYRALTLVPLLCQVLCLSRKPIPYSNSRIIHLYCKCWVPVSLTPQLHKCLTCF